MILRNKIINILKAKGDTFEKADALEALFDSYTKEEKDRWLKFLEMNQPLQEKEIIELYEQVAIGAITPNEARKRFLTLITKIRLADMEAVKMFLELPDGKRNLIAYLDSKLEELE